MHRPIYLGVAQAKYLLIFEDLVFGLALQVTVFRTWTWLDQNKYLLKEKNSTYKLLDPICYLIKSSTHF